ncbi:MAG: LysR family transcriptional regulator [Pseudomonadota bacterium]
MNRSANWNHLRAFFATAETGSLSAAADILGLTQPTLGRQIKALEETLGLALFERSGRALTLTETGREFLADVHVMNEAAAHVTLLADSRTKGLEGKVKVTASDMTSAYVLPDVLVRLRRLAPDLRIDVISANDIRDILHREADIAIRHVRPDQPELIARLIGNAPAHLYAAKSYIEANGEPKSLDDLNHHDFISLGDDRRMIEEMAKRGICIKPEKLIAGSTSGIACWELAQKGLGLFPMTDSIANLFPNMIPVLAEDSRIEIPTWLVAHRDMQTSRRLRIVFDLLADILTDRLRKTTAQ